MRSRGFERFATACALAAACAFVGCARTSADPRAPAAATAGSPTATTDPFVLATRRIERSVVLFTMKLPSDDPKRKGEFDDAYGSGVVVASGAWGSQILTAQHVVQDARDLRASPRGEHPVRARVESYDTNEDLALVAVATPELPVARLAPGGDYEPGLPVGVTGFPVPDAFDDEKLGTKPSVFAGRVSSVRRDAIELDLPIIPGESGGPVYDARSGDVLALADSRFDEEKAIGFGIPLADLRRFLGPRLRSR